MMDAESAKTRSGRELQGLAVRVNETLPLLEDVSELDPRTPVEVAVRAVVLGYVLRFAFGRPAAECVDLIARHGLTADLSPEEERLLTKEAPTRQEIIDATWQIEAVQCLAWCLGLSDLDPTKECSESLASLFPSPEEPPGAFIEDAVLRPFDELYQQADLHYRMHWATRDARLHGYSCPLSESVISERRRAIDWVIGVAPDWYDMPMDT